MNDKQRAEYEKYIKSHYQDSYDNTHDLNREDRNLIGNIVIGVVKVMTLSYNSAIKVKEMCRNTKK